MTPIELVDELVGFIKQAVKEYDLSTKANGITKAPEVYSGYLPSKGKGEDSSEFPYVIVRYISEEDNEDDTVSIRIIIGAYNEDEQNGWRDPLNIATRLKVAFRRTQIIGSFSLKDKIEIELFEEQPFPYWFAIMDLNFYIQKVQMDWSEHNFDF
ncbi:hypothetical protein N4T77_02685 [Clostridium sp. CX1]|uniref:hypothetical protein n=1 Tax=Clostridium sp. CX1 TaxID=2978346 RepID=UPI0021C10958|nr:hypothetical protein [Clostridium sp. CX1]MCT8975497.1 hypothetical protein [Clostridium sp. CX1]